MLNDGQQKFLLVYRLNCSICNSCTNKIISMNNSVNLSNLQSNSYSRSFSSQKYSFPKSHRFTEPKEGNSTFYDLPSVKARRSTSFGFDNRDIGIRYQKKSPSPESYNLPSSFQQTKQGFGFGKGREDMEITGAFHQSKTKQFIPGPGNYENRSSLKLIGNTTLKSRLRDTSLDHLKKNPGPGTYRFEEMGKPNYYITSRHINQVNFKVPSGPRSSLISKGIAELGPGRYDHSITETNNVGRYVLSKNKGNQSRRFSTGCREPIIMKHSLGVPGPGHYNQQ